MRLRRQTGIHQQEPSLAGHHTSNKYRRKGPFDTTAFEHPWSLWVAGHHLDLVDCQGVHGALYYDERAVWGERGTRRVAPESTDIQLPMNL